MDFFLLFMDTGLIKGNVTLHLVERRTCNPKVIGSSLDGDYHQSLVSPSQKQCGPRQGHAHL